MEISKRERRRLLIEAINQAFEGVELEDGVSLHETDVIDDWGSTAARRAARKYDTEASWQDVRRPLLAEYYLALSFFDAKGLRFYLPAYMVWTLEVYHTTSSASAEMTIFALCPTQRRKEFELSAWQLERFKIFNEAQARTICGFLRYMQAEDGSYMSELIQAALDIYWGKFCLESEIFSTNPGE